MFKRFFYQIQAYIRISLNVTVYYRRAIGQFFLLPFRKFYICFTDCFFVQIQHLKILKLQYADFENRYMHNVAKPDNILF